MAMTRLMLRRLANAGPHEGFSDTLLETILVPLRGQSMHDRESELLRIPLPRTLVNKGKR